MTAHVDTGDAVLAEHIRQVAHSAPAPSPEHIAKLRALLPPVPRDRPLRTRGRAA